MKSKLTLTILALLICSISVKGQSKDTSIFKVCDTCKTTATSFQGDTSKHWILTGYAIPKCYKVNWSKVKTFKDLEAILQAMRIQFCLDEKQIKPIKKYLIESK